MSSDQNRPDELNELNQAPDQPTPPGIEESLGSIDEPPAEAMQPDVSHDAPLTQEPGDPVAEPTVYVLPVDRPGASATTGTGTGIAVGCVAVCVVILLITILILTIVS